MKQYYIGFTVIFIGCALGAFLSAHFAGYGPVPISFWFSLLFIAVASGLIHRTLVGASKKRPQVFVTYFMGSLSAKLFLSAMLMVVIGLVDRGHLKFTAIGFLIAYVLFTFLEIKHLLPLMKNKNEG